MAKTKTQWVCQNCGRVTLREMGKCPQCGEFNSMLEVVVAEPSKRGERRSVTTTSRPLKLSEIEGDADARLHLPIEEFARVLGGGIVPGSVVLVGGDPGIGKSTLLLQLANVMAETGWKCVVRFRRRVGAPDQNARLTTRFIRRKQSKNFRRIFIC